MTEFINSFTEIIVCVYLVQIMVILLKSKNSLFNFVRISAANTQIPIFNLIKLPYLLLLGLNFVNILKLNLFYAIFSTNM